MFTGFETFDIESKLVSESVKEICTTKPGAKNHEICVYVFSSWQRRILILCPGAELISSQKLRRNSRRRGKRACLNAEVSGSCMDAMNTSGFVVLFLASYFRHYQILVFSSVLFPANLEWLLENDRSVSTSLIHYLSYLIRIP